MSRFHKALLRRKKKIKHALLRLISFLQRDSLSKLNNFNVAFSILKRILNNAILNTYVNYIWNTDQVFHHVKKTFYRISFVSLI